MLWQIYLLVSVFLISLNGLWHKSLMKGDNSDPKAQTIVFLGIGGIFALAIALLRGTFHPIFPMSLLGSFLIVGTFSSLAYVLSYRAYQMIGAAEIAIFLSTGSLWRVLGAFLFLHEALTPTHILGTFVIISGIVLALFNERRFKINKGIVLVLFAAFFFAFSDISGYHILKTMDASSYQIYTQFLPVLLLILTFPRTIKKLEYYFTKERALKMTLLSIGDVLGMLALFLAYQAGGKASVISPLSATRVILTVILAAIFLGERDNMKNKLIGAVVTVVGIMLLL